jgi:magnesium chelatase family protein
MLAQVFSGAIVGLEAELINVEVDFNPHAMPGFTIVGLPDAAVQESRERVRAAVKNRGMAFPAKRYTVNLAPADLRKAGPAYDLPIAVGVLIATEQIPSESVQHALFVGELSLDGSLRHTHGVLALAQLVKDLGFERIYVPAEDAPEAALIEGIDVIPLVSLGHFVEHAFMLNVIPPYNRGQIPTVTLSPSTERMTDFQDIKGQEAVKRAIEVAAAGGHHLLMVGAPGSGKTLMARALMSILPPLTPRESLEVTRIYSVADKLQGSGLIQQRPFRAPHYTISEAGLVGGGTHPQPGEISLSHRGVLYLDELVEFGRTLEALRQPLEDKVVTISRVRGSLTFPANLMLVASMNPCPCGYRHDAYQNCTCSDIQVKRYQGRISGPILDRFDIQLDVQRVKYEQLSDTQLGEPSAAIRERIITARKRQADRYQNSPHLITNSDLGAGEIGDVCRLGDAAEKLMRMAVEKYKLSARGYHRVLKLARTIADLGASEAIETAHVAEAVRYRSFHFTP